MAGRSRSAAGARAWARARYPADKAGSGGMRPCADADGVQFVRCGSAAPGPIQGETAGRGRGRGRREEH